MLFNAVIKPVVEEHYLLLRADKEQKPGMITDAIVQRVLDSHLVVADLTGLNANVFYELGIRHAAGLPTIHVSADDPPLPFDNAGHSTIFLKLDDWNSMEAARRDLSSQVQQTQAPDFKPSNPVTQAVTMSAFAASSDNEERSIALLSKRIESLETELKRRPSASATIETAATGRLVRVFKDIEGRRKELRKVVAILEENRGRAFDEAQVENWIEQTANRQTDYSAVLAHIDDGDIGSIVKEIEDQIPF